MDEGADDRSGSRFPGLSPLRCTVGVSVVAGVEQRLTCAHVANIVLGRDMLRQDKPDQLVALRLPRCGDTIREARLDEWLPPLRDGVTGGDIAGLVIGRATTARPAVSVTEPVR